MELTAILCVQLNPVILAKDIKQSKEKFLEKQNKGTRKFTIHI